MSRYILPPELRPGDAVALVAPAGAVSHDRLDGAIAHLRARGYDVRPGKHLYGRAGSFSGSAEERFADVEAALCDPAVKALFCARGGYGAVHLLERLDTILASTSPKWLIGFSDISALHAAWLRHGMAAVHAPMARHLTELPYDHPDTVALFDILEGRGHTFEWRTDAPGLQVTAPLFGGNFAVLSGLAATPWDEFALAACENRFILVLEDINEPAYKLDRMMMRLRLSGALERCAALLVGQFTGLDDAVAVDTVRRATAGLPLTVVPGLPVGHSHESNHPLLLGRLATLTADSGVARLSQ